MILFSYLDNRRGSRQHFAQSGVVGEVLDPEGGGHDDQLEGVAPLVPQGHRPRQNAYHNIRVQAPLMRLVNYYYTVLREPLILQPGN